MVSAVSIRPVSVNPVSVSATQPVYAPGVFNDRPLTGAVALVPPGDPGGLAALMKSFQAVAKNKGPAAAIEWLMNTKSAQPLQALIKTPQGRTALAAVALGFSAGWAGGSNAPKIQALATALKAVSDQNLPPRQAAQQVTQVLRAALTSGKSAAPVKSDDPAKTRQVQSLTTSLKEAQANLKTTTQLLQQRPGDQDLQIIFKGQKARVAALQAKVNALSQGSTTPSGEGISKLPAPKFVPDLKVLPRNSNELPTKLEELSPWLQGEVRSGRMKLEKAVEIMKADEVRSRTMGDRGDERKPTCVSRLVVMDRRIFVSPLAPNGQHGIDTNATGNVVGLDGRTSDVAQRVTVEITVRHPVTNQVVKRAAHDNFATVISTSLEPPGRKTRMRLPPVDIKGKCYFKDGTVMDAVQKPPYDTRFTSDSGFRVR